MMFTHNDRHHAMSDTGHVRVYIDKTESADTLTENERDLIRAALKRECATWCGWNWAPRRCACTWG
jgi:hypothetical protein